jgi:hypothetical protein
MYQYQIIVDGEPWIDSDGLDEWPEFETESLAEVIAGQGYSDIEVRAVSYA